MTDTPDWEIKYWEQKAAQKIQQQQQQPGQRPHFEPAHITQARLNPQQQQQNINNGGWKDIDATTAMYANMNAMQTRGTMPSTNTVMLREGALYYRAVQVNSFGATMPMIRSCGPAVGVSGKEFEFKGETRCYLIDDMEVVDLNEINPQKLLQLIEISAPFIGTLLVEKNSIITKNSCTNNGSQILKG